MRCSNPLLALRYFVDQTTGKTKMKILPRRVDMSLDALIARYGESNILQLPCGKCPACLSRYSKEWAVRCSLEALDHDQNCFVTLTYDPEHYDGKPHKDHLQKFIKSLRNYGYTVRYFGVCERGDELGRYHYHILLFGFFPGDAKPWAKSQKGFMQYTSKYLSEVWSKGLVTVSEFSPYCAQYTAGYVVKKLASGDKSLFHIQSTRPGIGAGYLMKNVQEIYDSDKLILNFGSHLFSVPRYFDKLAANMALDLSDIKEKRLDAATAMMYESMRSHSFISRDKAIAFEGEVAEAKIRFQKRRF